MKERYLVWSHEHRAWWRKGSAGYTQHLSEAGLYTHDHAMAICLAAMPGAREVLNELPVRWDDLQVLRDAYVAQFPERGEPWM
jgi:hypothetical protein